MCLPKSFLSKPKWFRYGVYTAVVYNLVYWGLHFIFLALDSSIGLDNPIFSSSFANFAYGFFIYLSLPSLLFLNFLPFDVHRYFFILLTLVTLVIPFIIGAIIGLIFSLDKPRKRK